MYIMNSELIFTTFSCIIRGFFISNFNNVINALRTDLKLCFIRNAYIQTRTSDVQLLAVSAFRLKARYFRNLKLAGDAWLNIESIQFNGGVNFDCVIVGKNY